MNDLSDFCDGDPWFEKAKMIEALEPAPTNVWMPTILSRSLSKTDTLGWDYNPRSDRHSVIKCWSFLLDLLRELPELAQQFRRHEVVWGINTKVNDKTLDLVIGRRTPGRWGSKRLGEVIGQKDIWLAPNERLVSDEFWPFLDGPLDEVLLAMEAKSSMTSHAGGIPTLTDQLERFRQRTQDPTITVALVMVNAAAQFFSPEASDIRVPNLHQQPGDAQRVIEAVSTLPLRPSNPAGFDALGFIGVDCPNDGNGIRLADHLVPTEFSYEAVVVRVAALYRERFL